MDQLNKSQEENVSLPPSKSAPFMLIIGIIFIAANLRSPLTAVGPVADQIRGSLQGSSSNKVNLWKSPLAWQVTLYMGLQSVELYCMYAWLPDILVHQGMDSGKAGWMLSLFQLASLPVAFFGSVLAGRKANQRPVVIVASLCVLSGLLGMFFGATGLTFLWMILMGSGCTLTFSLSLIFFSFRTKNADEAARLSGMAQSVGYLLASFGPTLLGFLHDATNNWTLPLAVLIGAAGMCLLAGLGASRDLQITSTVGH
ncbi:Major Facilitator Superfamily protein [Caprobacter fermentans]|uniref:Major Facilitator Superfamily protein n=2 Tax=Caproicibacter fermentans TaxID=2576756 RepID=A0A6N8I438_9FIRM|nr:MFS transporter [Caproicibacter fermentans]MVB12729.1 Major Facilitator Superfamily protein [Caproicibacter fermentans]